nr:malonyl-ACP O-methyltransferase BioC [Dechloromonas sp.]
MTRPSKARVRQSFERAAATYDSAAAIQRDICHDLLAMLPEALAPATLLDAGCGTGYALPLLHRCFPESTCLALDLAPGMLHRIGTGTHRIAADLEHLPLAAASVDLYWSSLAVQWCDLAHTLDEARRVLRPDGQLALATLGTETFRELRLAFAGVDEHRHTLAFHTAAELEAIAGQAGFSRLSLDRRFKTAHYPDFRTLLRAVKAIGANQLGEGRRTRPLGRTAFAAAEAAYESLRQPAGLPLTYDVLILSAHP